MILTSFLVRRDCMFAIFRDSESGEIFESFICRGNRARLEKKAKFTAQVENVPCQYED